jgi:hypothetical protein
VVGRYHGDADVATAAGQRFQEEYQRIIPSTAAPEYGKVISRPESGLPPDGPFCLGLDIGCQVLPAEILAGIRLEQDGITPASAALHRTDLIISG